MDKVYSPQDIERRLYAGWEAAGVFAPRADAAGAVAEVFLVDVREDLLAAQGEQVPGDTVVEADQRGEHAGEEEHVGGLPAGVLPIDRECRQGTLPGARET